MSLTALAVGGGNQEGAGDVFMNAGWDTKTRRLGECRGAAAPIPTWRAKVVGR